MASILGLEIGVNSVRAALVKTALRKVQVARYIEVPIVSLPLAAPEPFMSVEPQPGAATTSGEMARPSTPPSSPLHAAIREVLRQAGPPAPQIVLTMPGEELSIRRISLPMAAIRKLDELLPFEMEALIPFAQDDTLLDHQPIETADGQIHLLAVAAPKGKVRAELESWAALGIDPSEVAAGAAALDGLPMLVPTLATEGPHVVLHFGARRTDVCVLRKGRTELARTISAGVADLVDVEYAASTHGGSTSGAMLLARELKQSLAGWRMQGGAEPEALWVAGEAGSDPRLLGWLSELLGKTATPLGLPEAVGADPESRARFALALGLAARTLGKGRRVDLRKGEFVKKRSMGAIRPLIPLLSACGAAIVLSFMFSVYARWSVADARRTMLEDELARVTRTTLGQETRSVTQARTLLETGRRGGDPLPHFTAYDALQSISEAIPTEVRHDVRRLSIELGDGRSEGHFELQGVVGTIEDRDRISQALGQVQCFRELSNGPVTQSGEDRRQYRIEGDIRCPGDEPPESESRRRRRGGSGGGGAAGAAAGEEG